MNLLRHIFWDYVNLWEIAIPINHREGTSVLLLSKQIQLGVPIRIRVYRTEVKSMRIYGRVHC